VTVAVTVAVAGTVGRDRDRGRGRGPLAVTVTVDRWPWPWIVLVMRDFYCRDAQFGRLVARWPCTHGNSLSGRGFFVFVVKGERAFCNRHDPPTTTTHPGGSGEGRAS